MDDRRLIETFVELADTLVDLRLSDLARAVISGHTRTQDLLGTPAWRGRLKP